MYKEVLEFWFSELSPAQWYVKDVDLDRLIKTRFESLHKKIMRGECAAWRKNPESSLAEIIVLDQFSRNIFRDTPSSFASDSLALCLSQLCIEKNFDKQLDASRRAFIYLPFMHSESKKIHEIALMLYQNLGEPSSLEYEIQHKEIIDRFGRYPHRNEILNRSSTKEEIEFLKGPDSSF